MKYIKIICIMCIIHYFSLYLAPLLVFLINFYFEIDFGINKDLDLIYKQTLIISSSLVVLYQIIKKIFYFLAFTESGNICFYIIIIIIFIINNCI